MSLKIIHFAVQEGEQIICNLHTMCNF